MNPKKINSQEPPINSRLNVVNFQSNLEDRSLIIAAQNAIQLQTNLLKSSIAYVQSVNGGLIPKLKMATPFLVFKTLTGFGF